MHRIICGLKPYPAYKDSGVPWLGEVPEHWQVRRIKTLFRETDDRTGEGGGLLLSLTRARGIVPQAEASNRIASVEDLSKYKVCKPGDLIMNRMQAWSGMFAVSSMEGVISPDYSVFQPTVEIEVHYFKALFKTPVLVHEFAKRSKGIGSGFNRLYTPDFGAVRIVSPPHPEQTAIVRFLDWADWRIQRVIRVQEKRIKLLEEYKQALIHQAVTGQIDVRTGKPYPAYKDSGVEWLGKVPAQWEVVALRRRWSVIDCKHVTVPFVEDEAGIPLASVREVQSFELSLAAAKRTTYENYVNLIEGGRKPRIGDLIYCRNVSVGAAAIVTSDKHLAMGQDVCLIQSENENQRFLNYFLESPSMERQLSFLLIGSTFNRINVADIKSLIVVVPSRVEQDSIATFLDTAMFEAKQADRKSTRLNSSHTDISRMPSSA